MKKLDSTSTLYKPDHAAKLAAELQAGDPDWTYKVEVYESGWAAIKIYDEDGEHVADYGSNV